MRAILPLLSFQAQAGESDKYHFKQNIDSEIPLVAPPLPMKEILIVEGHADSRRLIRTTLEFEESEIHESAGAARGRVDSFEEEMKA
jgi:hypothetical protein